MAKLIPSIEEIKASKPYPEEGELALVEKLYKNLDDSYEIYFQSYLNGLHPDIVILREGYGIFIIEVKDWELKYYRYGSCNKNDKYGQMILINHNIKVKTPFDQVMAYKNNLYNLYSHELAIECIKNKSIYGMIKVAVYFHKESDLELKKFFKDDQEERKYISIWGHDSDFIDVIKKSLNRFSTLNRDIYIKLRVLLTPLYHTANEGRYIKLTKKQLDLTLSKPNLQRKVKGMAGGGKTTILAYKAINIVKRIGENCRVLILTYNITLRNYIRDKISSIRENFEWNHFNIIHFHAFISQVVDVENVEVIDFNNLRVDEFKNKIPESGKYDAILIDEGQDFKKEWFDILKVFLKKDGEFFIMADEKQNIYSRELDNDKKIKTNIQGAWNSISETYRLTGKINQLALEFQKVFFKDKYELDIVTSNQINMDLGDQNIIYKYNEAISYEEIFKEVKKYADYNEIHLNNVCILSGEIRHLRALEYFVRKNYSINSEIMFETKEEFDVIVNRYSMESDELEEYTNDNIKNKLEKIRRIKKFGFNNNSRKLKICTIHSFKGWESDTLVLIIDKEDKKINEELVYTAITRCKKNLLIFNIGKKKYDEFFKRHIYGKSDEFTIPEFKFEDELNYFENNYDIDDGKIYCSEDGLYHDAEDAWIYDGSVF